MTPFLIRECVMPLLESRTIAEEIARCPAGAADSLLEALSECPARELQSTLTLFASAVLNSRGVTDVDLLASPVDALFSQSLDRQSRRFTAVCLLRLLARNESCEAFRTLRFKALSLFDDLLSEDIYQYLKLERNAQSYQKESKLRHAVQEIENDLAALIQSFHRIENTPSFHHSFMQKLNGRLAKAIIKPFLPKTFDAGVRFSEVFDAVNRYTQETGTWKIDTFETAKEILKRFIGDTEGHGTKYARLYLADVAVRLLHLLQQDFQQSPFSRPATLSLARSEKKYPFHSVGRSFEISLIADNLGPGVAFDTTLRLTDCSENLGVDKPDIFLGSISVGTTIAQVPCTVRMAESMALLSAELTWTNADRTTGTCKVDLELDAQRSDVDWDSLRRQEPYSLEPVTSAPELVGRADILDDLLAKVGGRTVGSCIIYGQKRVGKTSVAKTLGNHLRLSATSQYIVVYLEGGDYVDPDASRTLQRLGAKLCARVRDGDPRLRGLFIPDFSGALSPLTDFLESVAQIAPQLKVLFILDEVDELPSDLYRVSAAGNAFFLTIRAISGKENFGFVLVGGEKMEFILNSQGDALNKFHPIKIDYLDKETHWPDFQDLVRRPLRDWTMEVSNGALEALYEQSAGNPYFTKLICRDLFTLVRDRRDSHITRSEVLDATRMALLRTEINSFIHFWKDGLIDSGDRFEEITVTRKKVLLALGESLRAHGCASVAMILEEAKNVGIAGATVERELRDFVRRQILVEDGETYRCKVPFFQRWLTDKGISQIITTFADVDALLERKRQEEQLYVRPEEIVRLTAGWGAYKGSKITEDRVRAWLNQFGGYANQRLMFRLLETLRFYRTDNVRERMREAFGIVQRGLVRKFEEGRRKRADILVSYLDSIGKSGAYYAKVFADENSIYADNVVEQTRIEKAIGDNEELQGLVFVDDFIGTGETATSCLTNLVREHGKELARRNIRVFFVAICGFQVALSRVERAHSGGPLDLRLHVCDLLDESARCFGERSIAFADAAERERAKDLAFQIGLRLVKTAPLGYGDSEALVVFENSCPNNTLPVLWAEAKDWLPLFKRK